MFKRRKYITNKISVNPELRLAEIEIELEAIQKETEEKEASQPPYDPDDPQGSWNGYCAHMDDVWKRSAKLDREKRMLITPEFEELSDYGDVMSLEDFIENVKDGGFIDYDGHGRYVKDGKESDILIYPSDVQHNSVRKDFDTIIWFNR